MLTSGLIYEDAARYDGWLKYFLGGLLVAVAAGGIALLFVDVEGAYTLFGAAVLMGLIFRVVLPRRFQVFEDRVRIVLGGPFTMNIPLGSIKQVKRAPGSRGIFSSGLRFVTSLKTVVEISRQHGLDVVISPAHPDEFIEQVVRARDLLPSQPINHSRR
jgi:hypothetical protein